MTKKHMLIMLACCLVPLVAMGAIFFFRLQVNQVVYTGLILLCPVSHLLLMRFMGHEEMQEHDHHPAQTPAPDRGKLPDRSR